MNDYTWEDWCWDSSVPQIAHTLNMSFEDFMREIDKFWEDFFCRMCSLALDMGRVDRRDVEEREYWEDEMTLLYEWIVDYIGRNKEYVALIKQAMFEEEQAMLAEERGEEI